MKKILIISSFILILIATSTIGYQLVSANEKVDEVKDLIAGQALKEVYLEPYGYTLDNPNVILDPYGISPLTAMILFETKSSLPVTVTILGHDNNTTYTNTFASARKHYLPIYGLYPNTINQIEIKCGSKVKKVTIETKPLPIELIETKTTANSTNKLTFISSNSYPYALDSNNEVRWYLNTSTIEKIKYLNNGHLLLNTNTMNELDTPNTILEIDLLGKIYKHYITDAKFITDFTDTPTSLFILSTNLLEIDKQTGTILNTYPLEEEYNEVFYNKESNTLNLSNQESNITLNLDTKKELPTRSLNYLKEQATLFPFYINNDNYQLTKGIKFDLAKETKESNKDIFLVGYIEPNKNYNKYNIDIIKTTDNLQIIGEFTSSDEVYLILDRFLDKRVYDIDNNHTIINKEGLSGKYSIYLSINDTIYKTNNYIKF